MAMRITRNQWEFLRDIMVATGQSWYPDDEEWKSACDGRVGSAMGVTFYVDRDPPPPDVPSPPPPKNDTIRRMVGIVDAAHGSKGECSECGSTHWIKRLSMTEADWECLRGEMEDNGVSSCTSARVDPSAVGYFLGYPVHIGGSTEAMFDRRADENMAGAS